MKPPITIEPPPRRPHSRMADIIFAFFVGLLCAIGLVALLAR